MEHPQRRRQGSFSVVGGWCLIFAAQKIYLYRSHFSVCRVLQQLCNLDFYRTASPCTADASL
jgi:hypothetical protein